MPKATIVVHDFPELYMHVRHEIGRHGLGVDLNHLDVSRVDSMPLLFGDLAFTGSVAEWDVSGVTSMHGMFRRSAFNGDISRWDTSRVQNMSEMFSNSAFAGDVSRWKVDLVKDTRFMFQNTPFNGDLSAWRLHPQCDARFMLWDSAFAGNLATWLVGEGQGSFFKGMLPLGFKGVAPRIAGHAPEGETYLDMFGSAVALNAYLERTPFGHVHADALLRAQLVGKWASREDVERASVLRGVGDALGAQSMAHQLLVDAHYGRLHEEWFADMALSELLVSEH